MTGITETIEEMTEIIPGMTKVINERTETITGTGEVSVIFYLFSFLLEETFTAILKYFRVTSNCSNKSYEKFT